MDKHAGLRSILDSVCRVQMLSVAIGSKQELIPRNDLYFTLDSGEFKDSRNVEISCQVYLSSENSDADETTEKKRCIQRAISCAEGGNSKSDTYSSALFYHTTSLIYSETFKIVLAPQELERAVVILTFAHGSNKRCEPNSKKKKRGKESKHQHKNNCILSLSLESLSLSLESLSLSLS